MENELGNSIVITTRVENNLKKLLFKCIEEQSLDKGYFKIHQDKEFVSLEYRELFRYLYNSFKTKKKVTEEYIVSKFNVLPCPTDMEQHEIAKHLEDTYFDWKYRQIEDKYADGLSKNDPEVRKKFINELHQLEIRLEDTKGFQTQDSDVFGEVWEEMQDETSTLDIPLGGWEKIGLERKRLLGLIGNTGDGKSFQAQYLHAKALQSGYKVLHISPELSKKEFLWRLISQMGKYPLDQMRGISYADWYKITQEIQAMPNQLISTIEDGRPTVHSIESMIKNFKPDLVIIDYLQKIKDNGDLANTLLAEELKFLAGMYNCCMFVTLQTNTKGKEYADVPLTEHIKGYKCVADDFDTIFAMKFIQNPHTGDKSLRFESRKARHDNWILQEYDDNRNIGEYKLKYNPSNASAEISQKLTEAREKVKKW